jgi:hypothetical protein
MHLDFGIAQKFYEIIAVLKPLGIHSGEQFHLFCEVPSLIFKCS